MSRQPITKPTGHRWPSITVNKDGNYTGVTNECVAETEDGLEKHRNAYVRLFVSQQIAGCECDVFVNYIVGQNVINCGDPSSPVNGGRHLSSTVKGSIVKFYCKENYKLVGCSKRLCTDKGWTGRVPTCIG